MGWAEAHPALMKQESLFYGGELQVAQPSKTSSRKKKDSGFYWVTTRLLRESGPWYAEKITSPEDVVRIMRDHIDIENLDREHFIVLYLGRKNDLNAIHTVSVGGLSSSLVHPREVFKPAILTSSAAVLLVHNHPTGDPTPSREDCEVTQRLIEAGNILGIEGAILLERFICGDCEHIYYADEKTACPACGSIQVFNVYKHIEMVLRNSILADSFMLNTQEEKEDVIQFASELFYPIKQKKH